MAYAEISYLRTQNEYFRIDIGPELLSMLRVHHFLPVHPHFSPTEAHDDCVAGQPPASKERCHAVGDVLLVPTVDLGQFLLGHVEAMAVYFCYLLQLDNGLPETLFANQPSGRFDYVSVEYSRLFRVKQDLLDEHGISFEKG